MPRGGKRAGAGRRRLRPEALPEGNKDFATRVLARVGKPGWTDYADINKVKSDEDYALHLLAGKFNQEMFRHLLDRRFGKPIQSVNHIHDRPIDLNVSHTVSERMLLALQKAEERVRNR
jgi:hypothetical protein